MEAATFDDKIALPGLQTSTPGTIVGAKPPQKLKPNHMAIMSYMIAYPGETQRDIAAKFGVSESWLSVVINCDIFQEELNAQMNGKLFGPATASLREKIDAAASLALDRLLDVIPIVADPDFLLSAADKLLHRAGYAPKVNAPNGVTINNTTNIIPVAPDVLAQARAAIGAKTTGDVIDVDATTPQLPTSG